MPSLLGLVLAFVALIAARRHRRNRLPARVTVSPTRSIVVAGDGAVRSVQRAKVTMARADLDPLWSPESLENLARTYWRFLTRVTLGLVRVVYGENERSVVLIAKPLTLLRFEAPEYELQADHGAVRWRIRDGLLVARTGRGCGVLALDVRRLPPHDGSDRVTVNIEVEVANFYPAIAVGFSMLVYEATQSTIHILVTHAFLRSLATLDLAKSKVSTLAPLTPSPDPRAQENKPTEAEPARTEPPQPDPATATGDQP